MNVLRLRAFLIVFLLTGDLMAISPYQTAAMTICRLRFVRA